MIRDFEKEDRETVSVRTSIKPKPVKFGENFHEDKRRFNQGLEPPPKFSPEPADSDMRRRGAGRGFRQGRRGRVPEGTGLESEESEEEGGGGGGGGGGRFLISEEEEEEDTEEDTEEEDEETEEEEEEESFVRRGDTHNLAGHEANVINGRPLHVITEGLGRKSDGSRIFGVIDESGETLSYAGPSHAASTSTIYGKWTGVAPFANDFPKKVSRRNAFGGQSFSALDTFSLAYLVNAYTSGYHNKEADKRYVERITAAVENGFISEAIDAEEERAARLILKEFSESGHIFSAGSALGVEKGNLLTEIETLRRGVTSNIGDFVRGMHVALSRGQKRQLTDILPTKEGTWAARDVMSRDRKRIRSQESDDVHLIEEGLSTIVFNRRLLRTFGMEASPEYEVLSRGAKIAGETYRQALEIEEMLSDFVGRESDVLVNPHGDYTSRDVSVSDEHLLRDHSEHIKEMVTGNILKMII